MNASVLTQTDINQAHSIEQELPNPLALRQQLPAHHLHEQVGRHRAQVADALQAAEATDAPFLIISGPCSLHCEDAAMEYGRRLVALQERLSDRVLLVMRAYMEKPRTTVGWTGYINDPEMDGSVGMDVGVVKARQLLIQLAELGLPLAVESLNPLLVPFYEDVVSWSAIGARTVESQIHRVMASSLPFPVGMKNTTQGALKPAVDAVQAAKANHTHTTINENGRLVSRTTSGNPSAHVILRGGADGPNYDKASIETLKGLLAQRDLPMACLVDCSHGNSGKVAANQWDVVHHLMDQMDEGIDLLRGLMIESHLNHGQQSMGPKASLQYGVSVTDECLGWEETQSLIEEVDRRLAGRV